MIPRVWEVTMHFFIMIFLILLSACSTTEKVEHIEAFVIQTLEENTEGFYETVGYKKVNSVTNSEVGKNHAKTDVKAIEDFYDLEGGYVKTEIIHSSFKKKVIDLVGEETNLKVELQLPKTILIPDGNKEEILLTKAEKEEVKKHVLSIVNEHLGD